MKKRISPAQRRHMDYLRRKGLAVGKVYEGDIVITDLLIDGVSMKEYFRK